MHIQEKNWSDITKSIINHKIRWLKELGRMQNPHIPAIIYKCQPNGKTDLAHQ
jgi:hypothetical protein